MSNEFDLTDDDTGTADGDGTRDGDRRVLRCRRCCKAYDHEEVERTMTGVAYCPKCSLPLRRQSGSIYDNWVGRRTVDCAVLFSAEGEPIDPDASITDLAEELIEELERGDSGR